MKGLLILDTTVYYVYLEVYLNLKVVVMNVLNFSAFSTNECNDMKLRV